MLVPAFVRLDHGFGLKSGGSGALQGGYPMCHAGRARLGATAAHEGRVLRLYEGLAIGPITP